MSNTQRLLGLLALFTLNQPTWTPSAAAQALGLSRATTYRYFKALNEAGYVADVGGHEYALGPKIVELDRQIRLGDPLLQVAIDEMVSLAKRTGGLALLCRLYKRKVLCLHQEGGSGARGFVGYERGRAMPLYRGATSKVTLAFLPPREFDAVVKGNSVELARAGLPRDGQSLRKFLKPIRDARICVAYGEVDPIACGVAVPISVGAQLIGTLSIVLPAAKAEGRFLKNACRLVTEAGARIEADLADDRNSVV